MREFSEKAKQNMRIAALLRWRKMTDEERAEISREQSKRMKEVWAKKSAEEKKERARKAAETRRKNQRDKSHL